MAGLRAEVFKDGGGARTGTSQTLTEFTFTPAYELAVQPSKMAHEMRRLDGCLVLRGEFRLDRSNAKPFVRDLTMVDHQSTVAVNLIYAF